MKSKISTFYTYGVLAILIYCILLIFIGIIFGMAWQKFLLSVRWIFPILFILVFPSIVRTIKDYIKIIYILMPFIFISIIIQVVQLFFLRDTLGNYFGGESIQDYQEQYYALNRPLFSYYIIGFILLGTTVLSYLKQGAKSKIIGAALISSLLFFFLSATRGYILASGVFILILIILNVISLRKFVFGLMFLVIVFSSTLLMEKVEILDYASFSVERLGTLIFLAEGDITAGGSLGRLTNYSPIVMQKFYEQPLVGWGFSNVYHEFANGHVGNQTLLMQSGMIGFTFYMFLFTAFFYKMWHHYRLFSLLNPMKKIFLIFMAFMVYLLIVHSSSGMYFLYGIDYSQAIPFLMASFLGLTDICLKEAFLYETRIYA